MALIRPVSDLHLEFYDQYKKDFRLKVDIDAATILVLAGDIHLGDQSEKYIKRWSKRFQHIILVAGNHEFYNLEINSTITKLKEMTDRYENVSFLNNSIVEVEDVLFVGATLWSDYDNNNPISMWNAQQNMNDFLCIQYNDDRFSPQKAYFFHKESVQYFDKVFKETSNKKIVVVSHHAPSFQSIHPRYKGDSLNGAYASNLVDKILEWSPDLWIHGHMHNSLDYNIEKTRVVCNPRGYYLNALNHEFDNKLLIEI